MKNDNLKLKNDFGFLSVILIFAFLFLNLGVADVHALGAGFDIGISPQYPDPGGNVSASIDTYNFDANRATITWELDGKIAGGGLGQRKISFTAPEMGKVRKITARVVTDDGSQNIQSMTIVGHDVDLLWTAQTTAPVWYKGKARPVMYSSVKVTALPFLFSNGARVPSDRLIYEWYKDFDKDITASGAGKNSFSVSLNNFDEKTVNVKVSSVDSGIIFEKSISFPPNKATPKILFYENSLLEGPKYNRALGESETAVSSELGVRAEPYFLAKGNLVYDWMMNGAKIFPEEFQNVFLFRATEGNKGQAMVDLKISSPASFGQSTKGSLQIKF